MFLDYDENYSISSEGEVYSKRYNRILKGSIESLWGYVRVDLYGKSVKVHKLVADLFLPKIDIPGLQVDHINNDKTNNNAYNLRWVCQSENIRNREVHKNNKLGEKYICFSTQKQRYKVKMLGINYGSFKTFEDAIKKRDEIYNALYP